MFADQLRKSLLQAAIRGKLTEQLPTDGDARDLLKKIRAAKAKLIAEKKIQVEKPLPPISDEEIPFDLPDNWCWCRLGEISDTNIGLTYSPQNIVGDGVVVLRSGNIFNDRINYRDLVKVNLTIPENKMATVGDILICVRNGSKRLVGKVAIIDKEGVSFGAFMAVIRSTINPYLFKVISSPYFRRTLIEDVGTTTINQITQHMLKNFLIPLPPLSEQKRIVACLEELLVEVTQLAHDEIELNELEENFPRRLKNSLLQAAIQGKLTEQLPTDCDAHNLLKKIRAEKAKLIAEKKIKAEKPLPPVSEDEVPFDLPDNWCWIRLPEIVYSVSSKANQVLAKEVQKTGKYPAISQGQKFIDGYVDSMNKLFYDVPVIMFGDHTRNVKYIDFPFVISADGTKFLKPIFIEPKYFYWWMVLTAYLLHNRGYNRHYKLLKLELFPLPPLDEQKRIIVFFNKIHFRAHNLNLLLINFPFRN